MSDDLVKRLRTEPNWMREDYPQSEAADRIEAQAARIAELEAALHKIVDRTRHAHPMSYVADYYRIATMALKGEKDE